MQLSASGVRTSSKTTSGSRPANRSRAASPVAAVPTSSKPFRLASISESRSRNSRISATMKTRIEDAERLTAFHDRVQLKIEDDLEELQLLLGSR